MTEKKKKTIDWLFIDRKKHGGGLVYDNAVREILSKDYIIRDIKIKETFFKHRYIKHIEWFVRILLFKSDADILVQENFDTIVVPLLRTKGKNIAIVHHIDNSFFPFYLKPIFFTLEKIFYHNLRKFDAVITVGQYWKQNFLQRGFKNVYTIYNSFNLSDFSISDQEVGRFKEKYRLTKKPIIYIGNCQRAKGVLQTHDALKDLDAHLVASGQKDVDLPAPAINLSLSYREYLCLLKASAVVITMSKIKEGWCRTAHEAMLCQTPVIGSGIAGMGELLAGGKQVICKDFTKLKSQVLAIMNDVDLASRMRVDGYEYAKGFTKENFVLEWQELIKTLSLPKKIKVFFFIVNLDKGGGERVVSELSLNFLPEFAVSIVLFENKISYPSKGEIICLDVPFSKHFFWKVFYMWLAYWKFRELEKRERPDFVISFGNLPNIINLLVSRRPVVRGDNFLSAGYDTFWGNVYKFLVKKMFNRAHSIVVVSQGIAQDFVQNFSIKRGKIKVIYNSVNIANIKNLSLQSLSSEHEAIFKNPVIINIGRIGEQKGQAHLIKAFSIAKKSIKNLRLVILGEGELKSELLQLAKKMGLENEVYFLEWQKNPFAFLARSKIFVLSSLWEGFGNVIIEAMAAGVPVISTDCDAGPREILAPNTDFNQKTKAVEFATYGVLVPAQEPGKATSGKFTQSEELLAQAIIKLISSQAAMKQFQAKALERAQDFDIQNIIHQWDFLRDIKE